MSSNLTISIRWKQIFQCEVSQETSQTEAAEQRLSETEVPEELLMALEAEPKETMCTLKTSYREKR